MRAAAARGKFHHRDADLVLEAGLDDGASAVDQVVDVIEGVEVADRGDAVFLEHFGVQADDIARLRLEPDHIGATRQGL